MNLLSLFLRIFRVNDTLPAVVILVACTLQAIYAAAPEKDDDAFCKLSEFTTENEFRPILAAMPVQLEAAGAKIIKTKDGSIWLIGIGSTIVNPASGTEILRRNTVARSKAQASVVALVNGDRVKAESRMTTSDKTSVKNGQETAGSEETLDEQIVTEAKGLIRGMPTVATWMNSDKNLYFVAIGIKLK